MAESVKRRVAAARLAVAFVAAGTIAGATAWAQAGPRPPAAHSSSSGAGGKIQLGTGNIKNGSLLYQDFKAGQVVSGDTFLKYKKADNAYKAQVKGELGGISGNVDAIKGELPSFVKTNEANTQYLKVDAAVVHGDGSVYTGDGVVTNELIGLLDVPNLVSIQGAPGQKIRITNTSGEDLRHAACQSGLPAGGTLVQAGTLKAGEFIECSAGDEGLTQTLQLVSGGSQPTVATVSFSSIGSPSSAEDTVQVLVGP